MRRSFFSLRIASLVLACSFAVACGGSNGGTSEPEVDSGGGGGDSSTRDGAMDSSSFDVGSDGKIDGSSDASSDAADGSKGDAKSDGGDGGIIPGCGVDTDGDGITDAIEGRGAGPGGKDVDTDGDGTPDYKDLDSDDDTIPDRVEWIVAGCDTPFAELNDADGDGTPNFRDLDSDANGMADKDEACPPKTMPGAPAGCSGNTPSDFEGDGVGDWVDFDNDNDGHDGKLGLEDKYELSDVTGKYIGLIDTDGDGVFDVYDVDSDNDFIADLDDGIADPDSDGLQNFRDTDSEADGVNDKCEARAHAAPTAADLKLPTIDTDGDGQPDFTDKDTDSDFLVDGNEDKNGNCVVDSDETDRLKADTDGDGVSDLVEVTLVDVACAKDPTCSPSKLGMFYFIEPYSSDGSAAPSPASSLLALSTQLNKGDVGFVVDTTGSMTGEIANLKSSLSSSIIPALKSKIPSLGIGVAGHDDFPYSSCFFFCSFDYGSSPDEPYYNTSPVGFVTTDSVAAQNAVNSLSIHNGDDLPESQAVALYHAVAGDAITWPGGSVAADPGTPGSTFGALHFRSDALPILVEITDAPWHNGRSVAASGIQSAYSFSTFSSDDLVTKINALGAKFIGVSADNGGRGGGGPGGDPYNYEAYVTDNTGSNVPPSAFGGASCNTGVGGAAIAPDGPGGTCRSVYSINTDGTGLGSSIVDGVYAILASIKFDVYVQAYNDATSIVDVVGDFMQKVEPQPSGGTDPVTGGVCVTFPSSQLGDQWTGPKAVVAGADGVNDTIKQVNPGNLYCFSVVPKPNTSIPATTTVTTFEAWLRVVAQKPSGGTFALGTDRRVLFIVPPVIN